MACIASLPVRYHGYVVACAPCPAGRLGVEAGERRRGRWWLEEELCLVCRRAFCGASGKKGRVVVGDQPFATSSRKGNTVIFWFCLLAMFLLVYTISAATFTADLNRVSLRMEGAGRGSRAFVVRGCRIIELDDCT
jgi:hypothetical protein